MVAQIDKIYIKKSPLKAISRFLIYAFVEGRPLTTRFRWINPLVFAEFSLIKRFSGERNVKKPIYILGTGRSGSTFLGTLLSLHPDICFLNEPKALWHSVHPNEDVLGNYTNKPAHFRLDGADADEHTKNDAHKLYNFALTLSGGTRIVDKHGELIFRASFLKAIFPGALFIFLVRNGWDTISSVEYWSQTKGSVANNGEETNDWWGVNRRKWNILVDELVAKDPDLSKNTAEIKKFDSQRDMAAVEWIITMKEGQRLMSQYPESTLKIHYEHFLANSDDVLDQLFKFCGIPDNSKVRSYVREKIKPARKNKPCSLSPLIEPTFLKVMKKVGY